MYNPKMFALTTVHPSVRPGKHQIVCELHSAGLCGNSLAYVKKCETKIKQTAYKPEMLVCLFVRPSVRVFVRLFIFS
jgi:hypothetical protein